MTTKSKILFTAAAVLSFSGAAFADNHPNVTLGGQLDTYYGHISQKSGFRTQAGTVGGNPVTYSLPDHALVNDTNIVLKADGKVDNWNAKYGGLIRLNADVSQSSDLDNDKANQTMFYIESPMGRLEAGSYTGAAHALHVSATQLGRGNNGIDGHGSIDSNWYRWVKSTADNGDAITQAFLLTPQLYTSNIALAGVKGVNSAKVTYYTPSYYGFKAGISYAPQNASYGTVAQATNLLKKEAALPYDIYRNVFSGGFHYAHKMDKFNVKAGLVGEYGTSKVITVVDPNDPNATIETKFRRLRTWEAGLAAEYMKWTIAGAYGDLGKSLTLAANARKRAHYWNVGLSYEHGPMGVSLSYASTKSQFDLVDANLSQRKTDTVGVSADWKLAKGAKLYTDVLSFKNKEGDANLASNRGYVVRVGSFLNF